MLVVVVVSRFFLSEFWAHARCTSEEGAEGNLEKHVSVVMGCCSALTFLCAGEVRIRVLWGFHNANADMFVDVR